MGNPDERDSPALDSRAHDPSTKDRVVCEDLYVRIGTRGVDRDTPGRTPSNGSGYVKRTVSPFAKRSSVDESRGPARV